jgi:hypothetical protein
MLDNQHNKKAYLQAAQSIEELHSQLIWSLGIKTLTANSGFLVFIEIIFPESYSLYLFFNRNNTWDAKQDKYKQVSGYPTGFK